MGSTEICKPGHKLRLLLLEEHGTGEDPVVWEMDYDGNNLPGDPRTSPEKLHQWLSQRKICPCEPRRHAEKELARKMEELQRSNQELEQFAYVASHDLREPLRMVATYTQLLAERYRGKFDQSADQYLSYAADGALRMQALIQDLLNLSRVGQDHAPRQSVDCNSAVEEVLRDMEPLIRESSAVVYCDALPVVNADRTYVIQIFRNLISNALKFRRTEPPAVSVVAEPAGSYWQFAVTDNGIGVPGENQAHVFDIFRRLHGRNEYPGNGMGLAICKKVVEHYGGRIWLDSRVGFGSSFKFTLPGGAAVEGAS